MSFFRRRRSSRTFLVEGRRAQVRYVQAHHDLRCLAEPPTGRRASDSEIRGDGHVPGALDEIPKAVVVTVLRAGRGRHGHDHRPFPHAAQLLEDDGERPPPCVRRRDDNSRGKVQNVLRDSSVGSPASLQLPPLKGFLMAPSRCECVLSLMMSCRSWRSELAIVSC